MKIIVDREVSKVVEFMLDNLKGQHRQRVAHAVVVIADLLWAYDENGVRMLEKSFELEREKSMSSYRDFSCEEPLLKAK
jgi:hypothetical protein